MRIFYDSTASSSSNIDGTSEPQWIDKQRPARRTNSTERSNRNSSNNNDHPYPRAGSLLIEGGDIVPFSTSAGCGSSKPAGSASGVAECSTKVAARFD